MEKPFGLISVYDADPTPLLRFFNELVIFDQATERLRDTGVLKNLPNIEPVQHVGHDIKNMCDWIVKNYNNLPQRVAFIKSNIVPRHVDSYETLGRFLKRKVITPLWHTTEFGADPNMLKKPSAASIVQGGGVTRD